MRDLLTLKNIIWNIPNKQKEIFLTFDDGPNPSTTEFILECLDKYNAKATFFCIGKNVEKYPQLFEAILKGGHTIGNHTYNHLKGWKCSLQEYIDDVQLASKFIESNLFRPPYGQISFSQAKVLHRTYKIVFWSVLTWDFKIKIEPSRCLDNTSLKTKMGDIIVFHDSTKAFHKVEHVLPVFVSRFKELGYSFEAIK